MNMTVANEKTQVHYLLDSISCDNMALVSYIKHVWLDDGPMLKLKNFLLCTNYLHLACPAKKKKDNSAHQKSLTVLEIQIWIRRDLKTGIEL